MRHASQQYGVSDVADLALLLRFLRRWNPHVHAIVSRGGWTAGGEWVPLPYVDSHAAELLFRAEVFQLLQRRGLLTDERIRLHSSWRRSGFSVDNSATVYPAEEAGLERLACYLLRSPVSLKRCCLSRSPLASFSG